MRSLDCCVGSGGQACGIGFLQVSGGVVCGAWGCSGHQFAMEICWGADDLNCMAVLIMHAANWSMLAQHSF